MDFSGGYPLMDLNPALVGIPDTTAPLCWVPWLVPHPKEGIPVLCRPRLGPLGTN